MDNEFTTEIFDILYEVDPERVRFLIMETVPQMSDEKLSELKTKLRSYLVWEGNSSGKPLLDAVEQESDKREELIKQQMSYTITSASISNGWVSGNTVGALYTANYIPTEICEYDSCNNLRLTDAILKDVIEKTSDALSQGFISDHVGPESSAEAGVARNKLDSAINSKVYGDLFNGYLDTALEERLRYLKETKPDLFS